MATSDSGGPGRGPGHKAGDIILAGCAQLVLRAYRKHGPGLAGWRAAAAALRQAFPEARANSIAAALRTCREGMDVGRRAKRNRPTWCPAGIPDCRPLIRAARREQ